MNESVHFTVRSSIFIKQNIEFWKYSNSKIIKKIKFARGVNPVPENGTTPYSACRFFATPRTTG
jgi:hypothetical protein